MDDAGSVNRRPMGVDPDGRRWVAPFRSDGTCPLQYYYDAIYNENFLAMVDAIEWNGHDV